MASDIRLFSTDLDGTLLGNPQACWRFADAWNAVSPGLRPILVYNTNRTVEDTQALVAARGLPEPDYIIGSIGTELHDSLYNRGGDFRQQIGDAWDRDLVRRIVAQTPGVREQPAECQHPLKSSWYWERARREEVGALRERLREAGVHAHVDYSCRHFLDVVPARAGKGRALTWLCQRLQIPTTQVLVAGDTANDISMFLLPGVNGIIVENALPELHSSVPPDRMYLARTAMADGVVEGLRHFGVLGPVEVPA